MAEIHYLTQKGLDDLKQQLAEAIAQRPIISKAIGEARDKGDLSENAEYDAAREAQGLLELKISKLQDTLATARVLDESKLGTETVQLLNTVKIKNLANNAVMTFTIVGESEANFREGKLAIGTPIAQALLGKRKGEIAEAKVPSGIVKFEIIDISI